MFNRNRKLIDALYALRWQQIVSAARIANGGRLGFDPNRDAPEHGFKRGQSPKAALAAWTVETAKRNRNVGQIKALLKVAA